MRNAARRALKLAEQYGVLILRTVLVRPDLGRTTPAALRQADRWRHPWLVFRQSRRRCGRLHRRGMERAVANVALKTDAVPAPPDGARGCAAFRRARSFWACAKLDTLMGRSTSNLAHRDSKNQGALSWVRPDNVNTLKLYRRRSPPALPSIQDRRSTDKAYAGSRLRLRHSPLMSKSAKASPSRRGVPREFGVPARTPMSKSSFARGLA